MFKHLKRLTALKKITSTCNGELPVGPLGPGVEGILKGLEDNLSTMSCYGYDRMYWLADGYFEELVLDQSNKNFIESRLPKAEHYHSTIAELSYWGWLKARGLNPQLIEKDGFPDLIVGKDKSGDPVFCDVKALMPNSNTKRVQKLIQKANSQIKTAGGEKAKGYCVIKLVTDGAYVDIDRHNECCDIARKIMQSDNCRSVNFVIFIWESVNAQGNFPGWFQMNGIRQSTRINHSKPRANIRLVGDLEPKATIAVTYRITGSGGVSL